MTIRTAIAATFLATGMLASAEDILSVRAPADVKLDTNPESAFWKGGKLVAVNLDNRGKPAGLTMDVSTRWTSGNIYFLFKCPYEELYLKPNPSKTQETYELWNWDVAEVFIGSDFKNIRRYKEFEVSPQGEWVDLDIDLAKPHHEDGWKWNSGFECAARIDKAAKIWYAALRIPLNAIDSRKPANGTEFRVNLYLSEGPPSKHKSMAWQPTLVPNFHIPERFGKLRLAGE